MHRTKRDLRCKVLNVILLSFKSVCRDEHREVAVLKAEFLDLGVKPVWDALPDAERPRPQDVAATDVVILNHLRLRYHLHTSIAIVTRIIVNPLMPTVDMDCIEQCLTSPPTQYRLYGRQFYWSKDPTNSIKVLKEKPLLPYGYSYKTSCAWLG